jgi:deoxyribodipyrimidine photo-lyase
MLPCLNDIRVLPLNKAGNEKGPVVYWMSRDQRACDNWALVYAQEAALQLKSPLYVVFALVPDFLEATLRQYDFMLSGLAEVAAELKMKNIPFILVEGDPREEILRFITKRRAGLLITDFDPLRVKRSWKRHVAHSLKIPFYEIDAHNIVPCWHASPKREFGAYTLRPKINRLLNEFLVDIPPLKKHPYSSREKPQPIDWQKIRAGLKINRHVQPVEWLVPGSLAAQRVLTVFVKNKLNNYALQRNDPAFDATSNLSPYLHFGNISSERVALIVQTALGKKNAKETFLEELIVRRELADNFCFYNKFYDDIRGFPAWAIKTLNEHRDDARDYIYSLKQFEQAETHDPLWNAAQMEMITQGKMHGYMRMYWCKKILEWTRTPEDAIKIAIYLNDKYELDGRDPNGYTGVAWSIGGVHDRAWGARKVFGKIRYMSYNGCKSKFDIDKYLAKTEDDKGT